MLINIDNMAAINMKIGEKQSNDLIRDILQVVKRSISGQDYVFRNQGDEFGIVFIDKNIDEVYEISYSMLDKVKLLSDKHNVNVSFSGGISSLTSDSNNFNKIYKEAVSYKNKAKLNEKGTVLSIKNMAENLNRRLLILDNDKVILSILSNRYRNKGYAVSTFEDPNDALDAIGKEDFDLIITDFYMETMGGDTLIKSIRSINKNIYILILSGQKSEDSIKSAMESGADDYVKKPFSPIELDLRISRFFR
jgi:diguanylate cyclase (GGDEF)-like protein